MLCLRQIYYLDENVLLIIINKANESMIGNRPIYETDNPKMSVWTLTG